MQKGEIMKFKVGDVVKEKFDNRVCTIQCLYDNFAWLSWIVDGLVYTRDVGISELELFVETTDYDQKIKNINERLGVLEAREGKLAKMQVKDIATQLNLVRGRLDALEGNQ